MMNLNSKNGFTLLMSVLIVSIMLAISLGISNIITGEIFLSNTGRQSQVAFYAADAGVECAIYWDTVHQGLSQSAFTTSTPSGGHNTLNNACAGDKLTVGGTDAVGGISTFTLTFDNNSCAIVTVTKRQNPITPTFIEMFIHADGYSEGASDDGGVATCSSNSTRVFQRSIETTVRE